MYRGQIVHGFILLITCSDSHWVNHCNFTESEPISNLLDEKMILKTDEVN